MKIVFSYVDLGCPDPKNSKKLNLNMAKLSFYFAKKHGYKTALYVDNKNKHLFKQIPYDEVIILDQYILDFLPRNIWSLGKVLTFSKVKEPFCHIDFDLFVVSNELDLFKNNDFFCFHREVWNSRSTPILSIFEEITKKIDCLKNDDLMMYNCAMVGGKNFEIINESAKIVLDTIIKEKKFIDSYIETIKRNYPTWRISAYIEQMLFTNLCKQKLNLTNIPVILYDSLPENENPFFFYKKMIEKKIIHLWEKKGFYSKDIDNLFRFTD
jgi:hypothetical protein